MKAFLAILLLIPAICSAKDIIVLEIDTGVYKHSDFISHIEDIGSNTFDFTDAHGHGTAIAGLILKNTCAEVKLHSCAYFNILDKKENNTTNIIKCFERAAIDRPDIINLSSGGEDHSDKEFNALKRLEALNIPIITAAGNDNHDLQKFGYYPAKYKLKNIIAVGNLNKDGEREKLSNYNLPGMKWRMGTRVFVTRPNDSYGLMTGTSMSAAIYTNDWLKEKCDKIHKKSISK